MLASLWGGGKWAGGTWPPPRPPPAPWAAPRWSLSTAGCFLWPARAEEFLAAPCAPKIVNCNVSVLWSRSRWSQTYLRPGAGAKIIFLINIFCSQFGGC